MRVKKYTFSSEKIQGDTVYSSLAACMFYECILVANCCVRAIFTREEKVMFQLYMHCLSWSCLQHK